MKVHKLLDIPPNKEVCETMLNDAVAEGWEVIGVNQYWIFLTQDVDEEITTGAEGTI